MMYYKVLTIAVLISAGIFLFNSCDDSGNAPENSTNDLTVTNLQPLNTNIDGHYEAWVSIETSADHGDDAYRTIGKFNVSSTGSLVDLNGNSFVLNVSGIGDLNKIEDALITIEPSGDNDTIITGAKIMGGVKQLEGGKLKFNLSMDYAEVLGSIASGFSSAAAKYTLAAPTSGDTTKYKQGVWYSQNTGGTIPGLTLPAIPDTLDWVYEAWVFDISIDTINRHYDIGRFFKPNEEDGNSNCKGSLANWQLPGHDWIQPNCPGGGIPDITNLSNGNYRLYITLEPRLENGAALTLPFYIVIFYGNIPVNFNYGDVQQLTNTAKLPGGVMHISN